MNTDDMLEITGVNLVEFIKKIYDLSVPKGMGYASFNEGSLTNDEAQSIIKNSHPKRISMDYINGRACKMTIFKEGEKLFIKSSWYDHSDRDLSHLLEQFSL